MEIAFQQINIDDFELCVAARKDAYFCSFGHYDGFDDFISGYRERVLDRLATSEWFYIHIFVDGQFAGQLEFRSFSPEPETGYVHLIYLKPNFRGSGLAAKLQDYIVSTLSKAGCLRAVLSVSRTNHRALTAFFKVVVIIRLVIKRLFFLDLDEPHQRVHSSLSCLTNALGVALLLSTTHPNDVLKSRYLYHCDALMA